MAVLGNPPVAREPIPPRTVPLGETVTIDLAPHFSDPDGDALTYAAATSDPTVTTAAAPANELVVTAVGAGVAVVTVTARDPEGRAAALRFEVTVPNSPPVVEDSIPAQTILLGDSATVDLAPHFSDPDGDALTYAAATSDPTVATAAASANELVVTAVGAGVAAVTVTARDPEGRAAALRFEVTVPNSPPVVEDSIPAQTILLGDSATVDLAPHFSDPDGDALTYAAATSDPTVATAAALANELVVTAVGAGAAVVTVTAADPEKLSVSQRFDVTVLDHRVQFAVSEAEALEGDTLFLDVALSRRSKASLMVRYSLEPDDLESTPSADSSDYLDPGEGMVEIPAGSMSASIRIVVRDDDYPEPVREHFVVKLAAPNPRDPYSLGAVTTVRGTINEGVCDRTPQLRDTLLGEKAADRCAEVTASDLLEFEYLDLFDRKITTLRAGDFHGLGNVRDLNLTRNPLERMPPLVLRDLSNLQALTMAYTAITKLEPGFLSGLTKLGHVGLYRNNLTSVPEGVFADLPALRTISLFQNRIDTLATGAFHQLPSLQRIDLSHNRISQLPPSFFATLDALSDVDLSDNPGAPFRLFIAMSRTDHDDLRAPGPATIRVEMPTATPIQLSFPLTVRQGRISADTLVLRAGRTESPEATVTADAGADGTIVVLDGERPSFPPTFVGLEPVLTDSSLVLFADQAPVVVEDIPDQWLRTGESSQLDMSEYFRDPEGDPLTYRVTSSNSAIASASVAEGTVKLTALASGVTTVVITASDPPGSQVKQAFSLTVPTDEGICSRTPQVQDGILNVLGMTDCAAIQERHLATIHTLDLSDRAVVRLHEGDFGGLVGLELLFLSHNELKTLPARVFVDLGNLKRLFMDGSRQLESLPADAFAGLSNLEWLILMNSRLTSLPQACLTG